MRMTVKTLEGGRESKREKKGKEEKKKQAFLTEATRQDHTAIFHSHSSAFAHDFKRYPSPEQAFQQTVFANFSSLSLPFGVSARAAQKGPPPAAVATVVVIVPTQGKHIRSPRPSPPPTMHHQQITS